MVYISRTGSLLAVWATIIVLWFGTAGCDFVAQPDRFVDESVELPVVAAVDFSSIRSGQHLAGIVELSADLDSLDGSIERVILTVDGQPVDDAMWAPYRVNVPTADFPDGPATLGLEVYTVDGKQGLLGLAGAPSVVLVTPVVFDQRPPTDVENLSANWENNVVTLNWTPNADANFYAYVIVREDTWSDDSNGGSGSGPRTTVLDTLFAASRSSFEDAGLPTVYGLESSYRVVASNRAQTSAPAEAQVEYGDGVHLMDGRYNQIAYSGVEHPTIDRVFTTDGSTLFVRATDDGRTVANIPLGAHLQEPDLLGTAHVVGVRRDGTEVFVFAADPASGVMTTELLAFSATDSPQFLRRLSAFPNDAFGLRLGPDGTVAARTNDEWRVYDTTNGQIESTLEGAPVGATVSTVGTHIVTQHVDPATDACVLNNYDPATGVSTGSARYPFDGMSCWNLFAAGESDAFYLASSMEPRYRTGNAGSMALSDVTDFPVGENTFVSRLRVDPNRLYLGVSSYAEPNVQARVLEVARDGQTVLREWSFTRPIDRIMTGTDGATLYVLSSDFPNGWIWRIPLDSSLDS